MKDQTGMMNRPEDKQPVQKPTGGAERVRSQAEKESSCETKSVGPALTLEEVRNLDQWIRRRMRCYYWKQWGRPRTRRRRLLALGIERDRVKRATRSRKGPWRLSRNSIVHQALSNSWLAEQGVHSIETQWINIRYPNGPKAHPR